MKALIVEDDFTNRVMLQMFLGKYGTCHVALNGKEAVQAFRIALDAGHGYNLVCMDVVMPEMDGHAALRAIRECEEEHAIPFSARAKIIMTTALNDERNILKAADEECDGYLAKPINTRVLLDHLRFAGLLEQRAE